MWHVFLDVSLGSILVNEPVSKNVSSSMSQYQRISPHRASIGGCLLTEPVSEDVSSLSQYRRILLVNEPVSKDFPHQLVQDVFSFMHEPVVWDVFLFTSVLVEGFMSLS